MSKDATAGEAVFRKALADAGLPVEGEYTLPEIPVAALRVPVVGDLIAVRNARSFFGPYEVFAVENGKPVIRTHVATGNWIEATITAHDAGMSWTYLSEDKGDRFEVLDSWVFADDPAITYQTDLERQVLAAKLLRLANDKSPWTKTLGRDCPPCKSCASWPCRKVAGCPDYAKLAQGREWIPAEKRFRSLEEMAEKHTIGESPLLKPAPTTAAQIEIELQSRGIAA